MDVHYRHAVPDDAAACVELRGLTRQNTVSVERLREYGITATSWANDIAAGALPGFVCTAENRIVGYCFGDRATGEVRVLALLPEFESRGIGRALLDRVIRELRNHGHRRLFLGCSPDPGARSYGFYRHLGWQSTGTFDEHGDEILELCPSGRR